MKGTFFSDELEYALYIEGEAWQQGDTLTGSLTVKNLAKVEKDLSEVGVFLALGLTKKIKAKDNSAFDVINAQAIGKNLSPGESAKIDYTFPLEVDCPITENASSLYIACGHSERLIDVGFLRLAITPYQVISNYLDIFNNFFKFKVKSLKSKKNLIEATLVIPPSKEFTGVEQLKILTRMNEKNLDLNYKFKLKKLDFSNQTTQVKDNKIDLKESLTPKQYSIYGDAVNQDEIIKHIDGILENIRVKPLL